MTLKYTGIVHPLLDPSLESIYILDCIILYILEVTYYLSAIQIETPTIIVKYLSDG